MAPLLLFRAVTLMVCGEVSGKWCFNQFLQQPTVMLCGWEAVNMDFISIISCHQTCMVAFHFSSFYILPSSSHSPAHVSARAPTPVNSLFRLGVTLLLSFFPPLIGCCVLLLNHPSFWPACAIVPRCVWVKMCVLSVELLRVSVQVIITSSGSVWVWVWETC